MANQTAHLNVSMMNEQGNSSVNGVERAEENLYSFSSDELEEMYSSSTPDTCGVCNNDAVLWKREEKVGFDHKMLWF